MNLSNPQPNLTSDGLNYDYNNYNYNQVKANEERNFIENETERGRDRLNYTARPIYIDNNIRENEGNMYNNHLNNTEIIQVSSPYKQSANKNKLLNYDYSVSRSKSKSDRNIRIIRNRGRESKEGYISNFSDMSKRKINNNKPSSLSRSQLNFSYTSEPEFLELNDSGMYIKQNTTKNPESKNTGKCKLI